MAQKFNTVKASYEEFLAYVQNQEEIETGDESDLKNENLTDIEVEAVLADLLTNTEITHLDADEIAGLQELVTPSEESTEKQNKPRLASTPEDMEKMEKLQNLLKAEKEKRTIH